MRRVVHRPRERLPDRRRRPQDAVEPRRRDHVQDCAYAAPRLPDRRRPRARELDLGTGVGPVAQLVLQSLDGEGVAGAVGQNARQQVAAEPVRPLGEDQEAVAHRGGAEPLVPRQADAVRAQRAGDVGGGRRGVSPHIRAALLLGHPHPGDRAGLVSEGDQPRVIHAGGEPGEPFPRESRRMPQGRPRGIRHGNGTQVGVLHLGPEVKAGRAAHMRTGARVREPWLGAQTVACSNRHELVVGGVVVDFVEAVADGVVRAQDRGIGVGLIGPAGGVGGRREASEVSYVAGGRTPAVEGPGQHRIASQEVIAAEGWRLIADLVRRHGRTIGRGSLGGAGEDE